MANPLTQIDLKPIQDSLPGIELPDIPAGPVGRFRLVEVLRSRFGENFRNVKGARDAINHFDKESDMLKSYVEMKEQFHGRNG